LTNARIPKPQKLGPLDPASEAPLSHRNTCLHAVVHLFKRAIGAIRLQALPRGLQRFGTQASSSVARLLVIWLYRRLLKDYLLLVSCNTDASLMLTLQAIDIKKYISYLNFQ